MSRRRRDQTDEALELFLDAISNAFGGVVFIALAVLILLQFTTAEPVGSVEASSAATSSGDAATIAALQSEIAALETMIGETPDTGLSARPVDDFDARVDELETQIQRTREQLEVVEAKRDTAATDVEQRRERLSVLGEQLLEVQQALEDAQRRPPDRSRVGRFRETAKIEVPVMLRAGRLVEVMRFGPDGVAAGVNAGALRIDRSAQRATPAPGVGELVVGGDPGHRQATALLSRFDPSRHYLAIAVWPDSFDAAAVLRDTAIEMGFDYGLTPIPEGRGVPFNAASGVQ